MSGQEYQEYEAILQNRDFVQDLFLRFQNGLDACLKEHYGNQFTRVINDDGFLLWSLQAIAAAHPDAPAESNAVCRRHTGEPHTEGGYFQDSYHHPHNPINPELASLNTLFYSSPSARVEEVRKVIANVDQQLPEDTTMSDPLSQNQPQQQQHTQPPPSSSESYQTNTASNGNPQIQQMRTQQSFSLAEAEILNLQSPGQSIRNHTSESGESSGAQSDNSFASGRKGGKRVAGRHFCPVEDCPKRDEPMQKCRLDDHMAKHDASRRTQCPGCDKIYMHSRTCNEHAKKTHGMDLKTLYEQHSYRAASLGDLEMSLTEEEEAMIPVAGGGISFP